MRILHPFDSTRLTISGITLKKKTWKDVTYIVLVVLVASALLIDAKNSDLPVISPIPAVQAQVIATPTITPSELESIVAYITRVFEPEGKDVVVQAINCFYSESGLRPDAVGHNSDSVGSTDWGIAQLNSYWQNLTDAERTTIKANIDKAYKIYKGRGNFSAWYGKRCN